MWHRVRRYVAIAIFLVAPLKILQVCVAVFVALPTAAGADEPTKASPAAAAAFEKYVADGRPESLSVFAKNGWQKDLAVLMRDRWKGRAEEGISLSLEPLADHTYRVGEAFDCVARLRYSGDEPRLVDVGGNCGMTDALTLSIHDTADGRAFSCRGAVGGPHCFCKPKQARVSRGETAEVTTGFTTRASVGWSPDRPGEYVVVGWYALSRHKPDSKFVVSPPLAIKVAPSATN